MTSSFSPDLNPKEMRAGHHHSPDWSSTDWIYYAEGINRDEMPYWNHPWTAASSFLSLTHSSTHGPHNPHLNTFLLESFCWARSTPNSLEDS